MSNEWNEEIHGSLKSLLERGNIQNLRELFVIIPELRRRLLSSEWSDKIRGILKSLSEGRYILGLRKLLGTLPGAEMVLRELSDNGEIRGKTKKWLFVNGFVSRVGTVCWMSAF